MNAPAKRKPGRPPIAGRLVVAKLNEAQIARAKAMGNGKVAAGIRAALNR
jgi:hypothetical protein